MTMAHAVGQQFKCSACDQESVVEERRRMEGWEMTGVDLVCALCGAPVPDAEEGNASQADGDEQDSSAPGKDPAHSAALALFGEEEDDGSPSADLLRDDAPARFCRDCRNYVPHPFGARCSVWDREADPMQDCEYFEAKPDSNG